MKRIVILLVFLFAVVTSLSAQQLAPFDECWDYAMKAIEEEKYGAAIVWLRLAELMAENELELGDIDALLGSCYYKESEYHRSIDYLNLAKDIYARHLGESDIDYGRVCKALGMCYEAIGEYEKAIRYIRHSLAIAQTHYGATSMEAIGAMFLLADCYYEKGEYVSAIDLNRVITDICKQEHFDNKPIYARTLINLSACYIETGNHIAAKKLSEQTMNDFKPILSEAEYLTCLNNLAICYTNLGEYDKSIELNRGILNRRKQLMSECNSIENQIEYATSLNNIASNYIENGNYKEAIKYLEQAVLIDKNAIGISHPKYAIDLLNLGAYYTYTGYYSLAINLTNQVINIFQQQSLKRHPLYQSTIFNKMLCCYITGYFDKIPNLWQESFSLGKKYVLTQLGNMTSVERQRFWQQGGSNFLFACNTYSKPLAYDSIALETAYNSMLLTKGMLLSLDIEFSKIIQESGNNELLQKYEEFRLSNAILTKYYEKPIDERPQQEVERLEKRIEELERDLIAGSKEFADFTRRLATSCADVRDALGKNDVAIEIIAADNGYIDKNATPYYAALVLRKEWTTPKFVELCTADELKKLHDFGYNLYNAAHAPQLYEIIWGKLSKYLNDGDNIYFSPSGLLHQINIEVLQDSQGNYANRKYNIQRVSSTREVCFKEHPKKRSQAALYGGLKYDMDSSAMLAQSAIYKVKNDYIATRGLLPDSTDRAGWNELSGTLEEVNNVQRLMRKCNINTTLFSGQIGTEESFKALSGKRIPIIHLATHGFFYKNETVKSVDYFRNRMIGNNVHRPDNSLKRSGLVFSGAQKAWLGEQIPESVEDGILLAEEITDLDLRDVELVVLSACETGLGDITSEGVFGLQRAFKKAGVQTIIMSLWKVDDQATSLMMETFYENLLNGKSKKQSFLIAQRTVKDKFPNPYYWASFIMLD